MEVISFLQHGFCNFNSSFRSSVAFRVVRGRSGFLETIFHRKRPVLLAYELWTVISVADCWNTISCKVGFCFLDDRG